MKRSATPRAAHHSVRPATGARARCRAGGPRGDRGRPRAARARGSDHAPGRQRRVNLNGEPLAIALVDDVQRAERPPAIERVLHEIDRPDLVRPRRRHQRLRRNGRQSSFPAPRQIEPHPAVHASAPFVIPSVALRAHPVEAQPAPFLASAWLNASTIGASRTVQLIRGRYNAARDRPTPAHARAIEIRCAVREYVTASRFSDGVTAFGQSDLSAHPDLRLSGLSRWRRSAQECPSGWQVQRGREGQST